MSAPRSRGSSIRPESTGNGGNEGNNIGTSSASSTSVKAPDTITSSNANVSDFASKTFLDLSKDASDSGISASRFHEEPMEKNQRPFVEYSGQRPPLPLLRPNRFMTAATDWWIYEITAWALSAVLLIAIWYLLRKFDERPLSAWTHSITLNSAVSTLATVMKGMLLVPVAACLGQEKFLHYNNKPKNLIDLNVYDTASRGVEGSFQLIFTTRARAAAYLGALITLAAIVLEPFVQQVVSIETRQTTVDFGTVQQVTLPRSQLYDRTGDSSHTAINLPDDMFASIYNGLFSPTDDNVPFNVVPNCPRGNCTFPPFQTLAVCSKCVDVASMASKSCRDIDSGGGSPSSITGCDWSLPNGLGLNISTRTVELPTRGASRMGEGFAATGKLEPMQLTDAGPTLVHFSSLSCLSPAECPNVINATECALYLCVNTYSATLTNGIFSEELLSSWTDTSLKLDSSVALTNQSQNVALKAPPINGSNPAVATVDSPPYIARWNATKFIVSFLSERLTAGFTLDHNGSHDSIESNEDMVDMMLRVLRVGALPQVFSNLASSMTRTIRQQPPERSVPGVGPAPGIATESEVFIQVRWKWLALPAALLMSTLLLLTLTIASTRRNGLMAWKCSPLALLFHGLDPAERQRVRGVSHLSDMRRHSRRMPVTFENYGAAGGWGFDGVW